MCDRWRHFVLLILAALFPLHPVEAQPGGRVTLEGTVVDDSTGAPLPDTHVFISGSTTGTTVDQDGHFHLPGVTLGAKRLYVTRVGYEPEQVDLVLRTDTTLEFSFRLEPTVIEAEGVAVGAERDDDWYERLDRFKRQFIGPSKGAERCSLLNPEALQFDTAWWGKFEAEAVRPLVFENRYLGYRVTYYLEEFEIRGDVVRWDGEPIFEPLSPRDSAQARRWKRNRRDAFRGSLRHFLLALLHDEVEEEHFRMYHLPRARAFRDVGRADRVSTSRDRILTLQPNGLHKINFNGALEVRYDGEPEAEAYLEWADANRRARSYQRSHIQLNEHPIHVDNYGEIVEPYGATLYKYFAFTRRLATLLPRGYRPSESTFASTSNR